MAINISTSSGIFPWKPASWLQIRGDDAATFLQGQFTNELRTLGAGEARYGLWLTLKGKVLADSFVLRGTAPNEFWVGSYFSTAKVIRERLESFVIADDVVIANETANWSGLSIVGPAAGEFERAKVNPGFVFPGRRDREQSLEWVYPVGSDEPEQFGRAGRPVLSEEEMSRRRIAAGIPAIPIDVGPADLPNEAGLDVDAISYTKGCYLGQEVMARLKSMGQVRRRLLRVAGTGGDVPPLPAPLFAANRQVGELRSAARDGAGGWIGLAMVSLLPLRDTRELSLATATGPVIQLLDTP